MRISDWSSDVCSSDLLFYLPSIGSRAEIEAGMAGLREDLYTRMLTEVSAQARLADDLGYDSISFTEHHFQIEGMELSNNPVLLDLFVAMQTKRIRVGQLGRSEEHTSDSRHHSASRMLFSA